MRQKLWKILNVAKLTEYKIIDVRIVKLEKAKSYVSWVGRVNTGFTKKSKKLQDSIGQIVSKKTRWCSTKK